MDDNQASDYSINVASIIGIVFGLFKISRNKILRMISNVYIEIIRGTPLMVQIFVVYLGIGSAIPGFSWKSIGGAFTAGAVTLTINAGAYMAEIVRGGIESVDKGQMEAARSLGMPFGKSMRRVILPQGIKIMVPSFINQFIITLKDTSILSVIGLLELTQTGKIIIARNLEGFRVWAIVAVIYLVIITVLTLLSKWIERRINN